jgi:UDP-glucose 4-epimerase
MKLTGKKILITGGAGFIGSHLCEELVKYSENEVWSLDNYSTGSEKNHIAGVKYIKGDTKNIEKLVNFEPNIVFHLGEYSRVEASFLDIEKVFEYNVQGTFSVLQFCKKHGSKIVYAGSSTKFGDGGLGKNQTPYGWTKSNNTVLVNNFNLWFDVPYAIVYFYNVYGKREISNGKYATLIGIFINRMSIGKSLTVVSPGIQKRNFTHVDDIVSGLILVAENGYGDNFGIGSDESFTILEIANMFEGDIEMLPKRKGNRLTADVVTDKTKALGWIPKHKVSDYIKDIKINNWKF